MSQPVKLSDELVVLARVEGEAMQRSIAGQVEFWANLGKAVDGLLTGQQMRVIGKTAAAAALDRLETVDTPQGRQRVKDYLARQPYPHYFAHPEKKGFLIREEEDGQRTTGRFVNREFIVEERIEQVDAA